jgi:hypothetical protein
MHRENDGWTIEYDEEEIYNNAPLHENDEKEMNINSMDFYLLKSPIRIMNQPDNEINLRIDQFEDPVKNKNCEIIENCSEEFNLMTNNNIYNHSTSNNLISTKPCDNCNPKFKKCEICKGHFNIKIFHEKHQPMCEKMYKTYEESINLIICPDCNLQIKIDEYSNHIARCSSTNFVNQTINCRICDTQIALHLIEEHEITCENLQTNLLLMNEKVECSICNEQVPYFELEAHENHCRKLKEDQEKIENELLSCRNYPTNWEKNHPRVDKISCDLDLVPLNSDSTEFKEIENRFKLTLKNSYNIISIKRIQNIVLWEKYQLEKSRIEKEKNFVEEKLLFFANQNIKPEYIYKNGFDISFAQDDSPWGRGICFYLRADHIVSRIQNFENNLNSKVIFLADVLTGMAHISPKPNAQLRKPPYYDASKYIYYDSITNTENFTGNAEANQLFVVYNNEKAYPKYMIEFTSQPKINNPNAMIVDYY